MHPCLKINVVLAYFPPCLTLVSLFSDSDTVSLQVKFGTLFNDDRCANIFEALVGTLRAAKKRKIVTFDSEMLFQGVHDNVDIVLVKPKEANADVVPVKPKEANADAVPVKSKEGDADVVAKPKDGIADVTPAESKAEDAQA
jgi:hypothetical protein